MTQQTLNTQNMQQNKTKQHNIQNTTYIIAVQDYEMYYM